MECPICYDSLHWKQVVCVPCGHLFHEACLNTFIQRRGAEYDEDVFDEDDDEDSAPKCPTCRTPIRQMGEEMMRELIPDFLRCRIHPAIRKVYLSPPTDDQAERMRETDHLWEKLEKIQRELSESASKVDAAENKASMMWNTVTVAEDKAKAAEKKASVLLRKVKDLGESLKKEQQRHKVFLHSVAVRSPKKAEAPWSEIWMKRPINS
ncbi:hypothetical protein BDY19DRAFT_529196 [Irpex rosettiformis]|uniref:Uncharacterized protein n=1 Tax=Irpex rosettiformis TaxID=378272 RepID=A0ACB8TRW7_9APHY|nr:hypothetical protein BDY19DRAFT_529196 [Irpex rosettiformis]